MLVLTTARLLSGEGRTEGTQRAPVLGGPAVAAPAAAWRYPPAPPASAQPPPSPHAGCCSRLHPPAPPATAPPRSLPQPAAAAPCSTHRGRKPGSTLGLDWGTCLCSDGRSSPRTPPAPLPQRGFVLASHAHQYTCTAAPPAGPPRIHQQQRTLPSGKRSLPTASTSPPSSSSVLADGRRLRGRVQPPQAAGAQVGARLSPLPQRRGCSPGPLTAVAATLRACCCSRRRRCCCSCCR